MGMLKSTMSHKDNAALQTGSKATGYQLRYGRIMTSEHTVTSGSNVELEYHQIVYLNVNLPLFLLIRAVKCLVSWSFESLCVSDPVRGN